MRTDMPKKLVERPRRVWDGKNRTTGRGRRAVTAGRDLADFESMSKRERIRPRHGARKSLNENLKPLVRFLERRVGRRWDQVYSELRAQLSPRSAIDMHIMQHLYQFVTVHTEAGPDGVRAKPHERRLGRFYVDPRDGVLCAQPLRRRRRLKRGPAAGRVRRIDRGEGVFYMRLEGQWFSVQTGVADQWAWDVVRRERVDRHDWQQEQARSRLYGDRALRAVAKRQLSRKALQKAGLR